MKTRSRLAQETMQKCRDYLRGKHYALTTEQVYCQHIGSYIDWLIQHKETIGRFKSGDKVKAFLTSIAHRGCSASTQNQAFNALLFLYEKAAEKLGLDGLATPHVLRHCCATHILDAGGNIRDVQELLGHASLTTTMIYVHGDGERVRSPLDALPPAANIIPFHAVAA